MSSPTLANSGTTTATGSEQTLATQTVVGYFQFYVDISALVTSDLVELRVYTTALSAGASRQLWKGTFSGFDAAINGIVASPWIASDIEIHVTLKQIQGTNRAYPWKLLQQ